MSHQDEDPVLISTTITVDVPRSKEKPKKITEYEEKVAFAPKVNIDESPAAPSETTSEANLARKETLAYCPE
eukprot:5766021-Ditylum_brightwellii.AAC.1